MYTDNQILLGKKLLRLQKKGFCVNAAEKELIKLFIINRKRLKEEKELSTTLSTDLSTS